MKKTSFKITKSLLDLENAILANMDIPRTVFHRRMIDDFVKRDGEIMPRLLITRKTDPAYIRKEAFEQIYLDDERRIQIEKIAKKYNCKQGIVLFQMLLDYCCLQASDVLGDLAGYIKE